LTARDGRLPAPLLIGIGSLINGKYRLSRLLGDGGMGSVYEAQHAVLGTRVAIKVLHPDLARRPGLVERFLQEARVAAQIRSPHVVQVTDVDRTAEGQAYIVMELLEGETLSSVLERQRLLPVPVACEYALQILAALEAAHALGVIHRDLKPENVFVTFPGERPVLKLIDFGIAKAKRANPQQKSLTVAGVVMGTAEYMAPEQARSADQADARSDIYAAGVMLYEMIAGSRPVAGDDARVIALKVESGDVVPLVQVAPDVPREIAGLVHRAMAARPELRFATATEMRLALEAAPSGRRKGAGATGTPAPTSSPGGQERTVGMARVPTRGPSAGGDARAEHDAPVNTMRAPPIASALAPPAYGGAALPAGPVTGETARGRRRRGTALLIFVPILLGAGVVAVLAATGSLAPSHASGDLPPAVPSPRTPAEPTAVEPGSSAVAPTSVPVSDVPKLAPTRPVAPPPHPPGHPAASSSSAPSDAGAAPGAPTFPNGLPFPTFPGALPSGFPTSLPSGFPIALPSGFPTSLPSGFPTVLPPWPSPPTTPSPPAQTPAPGAGN
jgi:eukaryotic-like serine/threonine-protein kinase